MEIERYRQSLTVKLASLEREGQAIREAIRIARSSMERQGSALLELRDRERAVEHEQAELDRLHQEQRALRSQGKLPSADVEILSPATLPLWPTGRGRYFYVVVAIVGAVGLALTAACLSELLDRSVRSHEQLRRVPGLAPAAMVTALPRRVTRTVRTLRRQPDGGMFKDAVRGIALSLERSNRGTMPASVAVTSAMPGEGKSLISAALALQLTATGQRVLLVDGDLRRGRVHLLFEGAPGPGLREVISGARALEDVIRRDAETGIEYIPSGASGSARAHERDLLDRIVELARKTGRILIFDSAPVLACTDAAVVSGLAERTLLVVRWGKTTQHAVVSAGQRLQSDCSVLVAINLVNARRHSLYGFQDAELYSKALRRYQHERAEPAALLSIVGRDRDHNLAS